jgi:hypothetical protein
MNAPRETLGKGRGASFNALNLPLADYSFKTALLDFAIRRGLQALACCDYSAYRTWQRPADEAANRGRR